ncbi:serine hydrolase domain-containing protein [Larkinella insperata]|uniref:Serine hydrolase domain-containing protein n=1 Tax=Larkinella insperata TaxID=332158 RepID=A0ABW3QI34_9BACT
MSPPALPQDKAAQFKVLFDTLSQRGNFNGCVLIAERGKILHQEAYGTANVDTRRLLTNQTVFELASISKTFTSLAVVQLKEKGLLSYGDSVRRFFPELPFPGVTIRHLLTNTSGIEDFLTWNEQQIDASRTYSNADLIQLLAKKGRPGFPPGTRFHYSNTNFALLASVIEKVSALPFADYLGKYIFKPGGMDHTRVLARNNKGLPADHAVDYSWDVSEQRYDRADQLKRYTHYWSAIQGAYGIVSNIGDLYRWDQVLQSDLLVKRATLEEVMAMDYFPTSSQPVEMQPGIAYRAGWMFMAGTAKDSTWYTSGSYGNYNTLLVRKLTSGQTVILLTNYSESSPVMLIMDSIENILEAGPPSFPPTLQLPRGIQLPVGQLNALAGTYTDPEKAWPYLTLTLHGHRLYGKFSGSMEFILFPLSSTAFTGATFEQRVILDSESPTKTLRLVGNGVEKRFQKRE